MSFWPDKTPKSTGNAFDWHNNYALTPTKFAADQGHRTPLYSKWCTTNMTVPWEKYRAEREGEAKLERRVHAMPKSTISIEPSNVSRIKDIPKAKRSSKCA